MLYWHQQRFVQNTFKASCYWLNHSKPCHLAMPNLLLPHSCQIYLASCKFLGHSSKRWLACPCVPAQRLLLNRRTVSMKCPRKIWPSKITSFGLCSFMLAFVASCELPFDFKSSLDCCHIPPPLSKQPQIESIMLYYRKVTFVSQDPLKVEGGNGDYFFITMLLNISRLECSWFITTFRYSTKKGHNFLASMLGSQGLFISKRHLNMRDTSSPERRFPETIF